MWYYGFLVFFRGYWGLLLEYGENSNLLADMQIKLKKNEKNREYSVASQTNIWFELLKHVAAVGEALDLYCRVAISFCFVNQPFLMCGRSYGTHGRSWRMSRW